MLKGISPLISPELLKVLDEMGHGDEIVLADANFPSSSIGQRVIRADGIGTAELLAAILPLFPLDQYDPEHFVLMEVVPGDPVETPIWGEFEKIVEKHQPGTKIGHIERFRFYEEARKCYAVISTGETALYANVILQKGVVK